MILIFLLLTSILRMVPLGILMKQLWGFRKLKDGQLGQVRKILFYVSLSTFISAATFGVAVVLAATEFAAPEYPTHLTLLLFCFPIGLLTFIDWWALVKVRKISHS